MRNPTWTPAIGRPRSYVVDSVSPGGGATGERMTGHLNPALGPAGRAARAPLAASQSPDAACSLTVHRRAERAWRLPAAIAVAASSNVR